MNAKTHSQLVAELLESQSDETTSADMERCCWDEKALAVVEHADADYPHIALEVIGDDGLWQEVFEMNLIGGDMSRRYILLPLIRLVKKSHPVRRSAGVESKS